jgi:F-type H+-transporting ATPase subunit b
MLPRLLAGCVALAACAQSAMAAGGEGGNSLIEPKIGTIFWTVVTFLFLAFILGRFAWKPLLGALDERQRSIEGSLEQAKRERAEAQGLLDEHKELVAQARRERAQAVSQGQEDAEKLKAEILGEARQQREQLIKQTEEQVRAGIAHARDDLRRTTADLAIQAAEKLLAKSLDDATQRKLVEDYLADLERSATH